MSENDKGYLLDPQVFDDPDREDGRPLYERLAAVDPGPITGSLNATGPSVDEIIAAAQKQIGRVAGDRAAKITRVDIRPLLWTAAGEIPVWDATVEFEVLLEEALAED